MAPFDIGGSWFINLLIGFGFGFVLESSGFGDARKIAGQFYFRELTVLKVMFTAIVVAATLLFWSTSIGLLDYQAVWVPPTHLWPGIFGGAIMGAGFVIGGYCPGTSLVSAGTGKIDGMFFVGGVAVGAFLFGETVGAFDGWWQTSGDLGRVTLQDAFGVDAGVVVLGLVLLALVLFAGGEWVRGRMGRPRAASPGLQTGAAVLLVAAAVVLAWRGQPDVATRWEHLADRYGTKLENGDVRIHPAELLHLMHDDSVDLTILDVRDQTSWNLFHLEDAERFSTDALEGSRGARFRQLPANAVVVVVDNDGTRADEAWKRLMAAAAPNAYVLDGGLNRWLELYGHVGHGAGCDGVAAGPTSDPLRHAFPVALGDRQPSANPDAHHAVEVEYQAKVHLAKKARKAGGCG